MKHNLKVLSLLGLTVLMSGCNFATIKSISFSKAQELANKILENQNSGNVTFPDKFTADFKQIYFSKYGYEEEGEETETVYNYDRKAAFSYCKHTETEMTATLGKSETKSGNSESYVFYHKDYGVVHFYRTTNRYNLEQFFSNEELQFMVDNKDYDTFEEAYQEAVYFLGDFYSQIIESEEPYQKEFLETLTKAEDLNELETIYELEAKVDTKPTIVFGKTKSNGLVTKIEVSRENFEDDEVTINSFYYGFYYEFDNSLIKRYSDITNVILTNSEGIECQNVITTNIEVSYECEVNIPDISEYVYLIA